ncbi:MAG: hypothetical protein MJ059_03965 [Lachnospiraceae bacterium]|nr:hypothetical protein [Lachnospiraceae bacterium]
MNRKIKTIIMTVLLCASLIMPALAAVRTGTGAITLAAAPVGAAVSGTGTTGPSYGKVPSTATVLVVVESNGEEKNATGSLSVYSRKSSTDPWKAEIKDAAAYMGRNGMGKVKEGDQKTPCGMFTMNTPFGIKDKEAGFPDNYLKLTDNYYWGGNSDRKTYNRLFDRRNAASEDLKGSEHLIDADPEYNYAIDTGYNPDCVGGKGSALFLHCKGPKINTAGCIAVEEDIMKKVLTLYEDGKTVIIIDVKGNFAKYE